MYRDRRGSCPFDCWCLLPASSIINCHFKVVYKNVIARRKGNKCLQVNLFSAKRFCVCCFSQCFRDTVIFVVSFFFWIFFQCSILKSVYFEKYFPWVSSGNAAGPTVSDTFALLQDPPSKRQKENSKKLTDESIRWLIFLMENLKAMRCVRPEVALLVPNSWFVCHALAWWSWFGPASWILKLHQILHNLLFLGNFVSRFLHLLQVSYCYLLLSPRSKLSSQ